MLYCMLMYYACFYNALREIGPSYLVIFSKWSRNGVEHAETIEKTIANKGDFEIYEIRYRWINSLFISLYSFINLNKSHIFVLFRYINPCTYI